MFLVFKGFFQFKV